MKRKRFISGMIIVVLCFVLFLSVSSIGNAEDPYHSGSVDDEEIAAYEVSRVDATMRDDDWEYDPTEIDEDVIESKAYVLADGSDKEADKIKNEMLDRAKENKALYLAAVDAGIEIPGSEVERVVSEIREGMHRTKEDEEQLKAVVDGMGITEDEYWEKTKPQYETMLMIDKYLDSELSKMSYEMGVTEESEEFIKKREELKNDIVNKAVEKYSDGS